MNKIMNGYHRSDAGMLYSNGNFMTEAVVEINGKPLQVFFHPAAAPGGTKKGIQQPGRLYFMQPGAFQNKVFHLFRVKQVICMLRKVLSQGTNQCAAVMAQSCAVMKCPFCVETNVHAAKING